MANASTDISRYDLTDETSAVSPAYLAALYSAIVASDTSTIDPLVIGVCDDGTRSANGWGLKWIGEDFNDRTDINTAYFDSHPSWQFPEVIKSGNYFRKIPIAYTKRGIVPSGPNAGKWFMMLSPTLKEGFEPHYTAFTYKGVLKDSFLWATYRAFNGNNKPGSQPGKPHWKSVSWAAFMAAAASLGNGYHMGSFQEYHEILARAVIEKKTFNLWPQAVRKDYVANEYRGIQEMAYDRYTDDNANGTSAEWRSGLQTDVNKNLIVFDTAGNWTYVDSGKAPQIKFQYISTLLTGQYFDHMFFAETGVNSIDTSMIPDYNYTGGVNGMGYSRFDSSNASGGAFDSYLNLSSSDQSVLIGSRLAYIE